MDIAEGEYSLKLQNFSFHNFSNVLIHGAGHKATIIKCHFGIGLKFQNSTQVKLANLSLIWGGQLSNSTNNEVSLFRASLYFLNCIDVELNSIVVTNSAGTGVVLYDVIGNVSITNSIFSFNKVPTNDTEHLPGGGGIYVEFSRLTINKNSDTVDAWYKIHHCSFNGNNTVTVENVYIPHKARQHTGRHFRQFGNGGGLSVNPRSSSCNGLFLVQDCNFTNNTAIWVNRDCGGGI